MSEINQAETFFINVYRREKETDVQIHDRKRLHDLVSDANWFNWTPEELKTYFEENLTTRFDTQHTQISEAELTVLLFAGHLSQHFYASRLHPQAKLQALINIFEYLDHQQAHQQLETAYRDMHPHEFVQHFVDHDGDHQSKLVNFLGLLAQSF